jgi:hypothetical protein
VLALVFTLTLAQTPVALVQSSNFGVPARRTAELTHALSELIKLQGLTPIEASRPCENRECVVSVAKELKTTAVMSLAFALVGKDTLLDIEALQVSDEKSIAQATFKVPAGSALPAIETTQFLVTFKAALPSDVPKQAAVVPEPKKDETAAPVATVTQPPPASSGPSLVPGITLGAAAVVAGAVSLAVFGIARSDWDNTDAQARTAASMLTRTEAMNMFARPYSEVNQKLSISLALALGAVALAGVAIALLIHALQ